MPTNRIPIAVLKRAAEALLPGPDVSRHEQRHGKKAKLTVLRQLIKVDPAFRKRVKDFCIQDQAADSRAYAREMGWLDPNNQPAPAPTDNAERDRGMWDVYRIFARYELESKGSTEITWATPNGPIPCLTDEEREYAVHRFRELPAGRLHLVNPKTMQPPEYIPSGTDWNEVDRQVQELEGKR
jgi:hypothetical protein